MKKSFSITLIIFILSFGMLGCSKTPKNSSNLKDNKTLTIGIMPDVDSIPFIIAQNNGYFKEEGITVKIEHFKSAVDRDSALQTGNIDGAVSDMLPVVFFNDSGFKVKITSKTDGSFKLIAGKNSNITKMEQINENSVGISKNTIIEYLTDRMMESSNIDINNIKKTAIPKIPTRLEMLQNGKLDMAVLPEPLASVAASSGSKILNSSDDSGINPGVILFTEDAIKSSSSEIKSLYNAYNKAVEFLNTNEMESYIDILIKEAGFPQSIKNTLQLPNYSKASMPAEKELTEVLNWLKSRNLTKNTYTFDELTDKSFIEN